MSGTTRCDGAIDAGRENWVVGREWYHDDDGHDTEPQEEYRVKGFESYEVGAWSMRRSEGRLEWFACG